jgi:hypothetical protein
MSDNNKSGLWAARGTKINSSDPPLTTVFAPHPTPPLLPLFHPPIEPTFRRPRGHLDRYRWINFPTISCGKLLQVIVAEIHKLLEHACALCGKGHAIRSARGPRDAILQHPETTRSAAASKPGESYRTEDLPLEVAMSERSHAVATVKAPNARAPLVMCGSHQDFGIDSSATSLSAAALNRLGAASDLSIAEG